ncbi:MAG: hypothetical protein IKP40_04490 [Clostridia bacterium]|nr:hypothetical protein [Clostridia bacterium]
MDFQYLGWPLSEALADLALRGEEPPRVVETRDLRQAERAGEKRVIRVKPGEWTVAIFEPDATGIATPAAAPGE